MKDEFISGFAALIFHPSSFRLHPLKKP